MERDRHLLRGVMEGAGIDLSRGWSEAVTAFLASLPPSLHRNRAKRELFRARMGRHYPSLPGSVIRGRVLQANREKELRPVPWAVIQLDCFCVARSDSEGWFAAEGIPVVSESVLLRLGVTGSRYPTSRPLAVQLPGGQLARLEVEVPVDGADGDEREDGILALVESL